MAPQSPLVLPSSYGILVSSLAILPSLHAQVTAHSVTTHLLGMEAGHVIAQKAALVSSCQQDTSPSPLSPSAASLHPSRAQVPAILGSTIPCTLHTGPFWAHPFGTGCSSTLMTGATVALTTRAWKNDSPPGMPWGLNLAVWAPDCCSFGPQVVPSGFQHSLSPAPISCHTPLLCLANSCTCYLLQGAFSAFQRAPPEPSSQGNQLHTLPRLGAQESPPNIPRSSGSWSLLCCPVSEATVSAFSPMVRRGLGRPTAWRWEGGTLGGSWGQGLGCEPDVAPHTIPRAPLRTLA